MREIKFRGMSAGGGFVYGLLTKDLVGSTAYYEKYSYRIQWHPESGGGANCPVRNDTIGQYTGLKDRNGKEIYEGDIVGFGDDSPTFNLGMYGSLGVIRFANGRYKAQLFDGRRVPMGYDTEFVTVYGNIHENPELVKT